MKYCPSCGAQVPENNAFCPNCGAQIPSQGASQQTSQQTGQQYAGAVQIENVNIVTALILTIVTCGIYGIIWFIKIVDNVNALCNDSDSKNSGGMVFLLTLVTCGIYGIIWFYNAGKRMELAGRNRGVQISDNSVVYLILELVGLGIVNYCLLQSDLNKFSK